MVRTAIYKTCPKCEGKGQVTIWCEATSGYTCSNSDSDHYETWPCSTCDGEGKVVDHYEDIPWEPTF